MKKLVFIIVFVIIFFYLGTQSSFHAILDNSQEVLSYINQYRTSLGQPKMQWLESLCPLATKRLYEIKFDFSHFGFNSRKELLFSFCPTCKQIGENLAKGIFNEQSLVDGWIESPNHQENLVLPYRFTCIALQPNGGYAVLISSF